MLTTRIYTERVKHLHLLALSSGRSWGKQLVHTWRRGEERRRGRMKVYRKKREERRREGGEEKTLQNSLTPIRQRISHMRCNHSIHTCNMHPHNH